ncbi:MAG: hypothetical protein SVJ22_05140 [Halobacteriota archaeon]|nr:hypothetical protein [Halobacteriota archaeon]
MNTNKIVAFSIKLDPVFLIIKSDSTMDSGSIDAIPLIRKTKRHKLEGYSLDKGYDAEPIHKVIREEVRAEAQIPQGIKKH